MNFKTLLIITILGAALSSCSTIYKSGQTPDDVYYSPARAVEETHSTEKKEDKPVRRYNADREIVMGIYDPRWRDFDDDYDYYYDPYHYGYTYGYYYNPYYYPCPVYISGASIINPKNSVPRMTNLGSYNYSNMVVVNPKSGTTLLIRSTRAYNNSNKTRENNFIRRIITPVYNPPKNDTYRPADNDTRTYSPSNNSSNSGSPGKSSGTPVARPGRGG